MLVGLGMATALSAQAAVFNPENLARELLHVTLAQLMPDEVLVAIDGALIEFDETTESVALNINYVCNRGNATPV